jgi:hypothetical protein
VVAEDIESRMKGIIAMKDDDQCFVVQAVNFSKAVRVRPITRIARLRIRTVSLLALFRLADPSDEGRLSAEKRQ